MNYVIWMIGQPIELQCNNLVFFYSQLDSILSSIISMENLRIKHNFI